jgi:hypothetical protein
MALKFRRKLGEKWVFDDLVVYDGAGNRQSIFGVADLAATLTTIDGTVVWTGDTAGCTIDEIQGDATTTGNFSYRRTTLTGVVKGTYRLDFRATINGQLRAIPEEDYIVVEVI